MEYAYLRHPREDITWIGCMGWRIGFGKGWIELGERNGCEKGRRDQRGGEDCDLYHGLS